MYGEESVLRSRFGFMASHGGGLEQMTDVSAERFWTLVTEFEVPDLKTFEEMDQMQGAPEDMKEMERLAPDWLAGCKLRDIWFQPTFHKYVGQLCNGVHIHAEGPFYDHAAFRPWRLQALAFKAIRNLRPDYELWRDFPYEYVFDKLAIDVINGGPALREWVDDANAAPGDLDALASADEEAWRSGTAELLIY